MHYNTIQFNAMLLHQLVYELAPLNRKKVKVKEKNGTLFVHEKLIQNTATHLVSKIFSVHEVY